MDYNTIIMIDQVTQLLDSLDIKYELIRHVAVVTTEQSKDIICIDNCIACKSLYVKDKKSDRSFMLVLAFDKRAEMRSFAEKVGIAKFEFCTEQKLFDDLHVTRGSVSPFAFVNERGNNITLMLDRQVLASPFVKFHPCDNRATVVLSANDFEKYLRHIGKSYILI